MVKLSNLLRRHDRDRSGNSSSDGSVHEDEGSTMPLSMEIWKDLPRELLLGIFLQLSKSDQKNIRLSCRLFHELITPHLFRRIQYSFKKSSAYTYCTKHGWYENKYSRRGPCNGRLALPVTADGIRRFKSYGSAFLHPNCPYFDSPAAERAESTASGVNNTNPVVESVEHMIGLDATKATFTYAHELTIRIQSNFTLLFAGGEPLDMENGITDFASDLLPSLLEVLPNLRRINVDVWVLYGIAAPNLLSAVCQLCSDIMDIHVTIDLSSNGVVACSGKECFDSLSGISSLFLKVRGYSDVDVLTEELAGMYEKCPMIEQPEDLREIAIQHPGEGMVAYCFGEEAKRQYYESLRIARDTQSLTLFESLHG